MTPGNNGPGTPEDDDPFGYLYADGQARGAQPPSGGYGYPNSVSRVRTVGERQYGQQQPTAPYGQVPPQQGAYGRPNPHYAAPETLPGGGAPTAPQQPARGGSGRGRGPNTKGLLIGAVAVVAAVVIGIGVAMMNGSDDKKTDTDAGPTPTQSQPTDPTPSASNSAAEEEVELPKIEAKALRLGGSAALASDVPGAQADGGIYVGNLNQPGASVTWTVNDIPEDGTYTLFSRFSATGEDQSMTLTVNGEVFGTKMNLGNFAHAADGDFAKGWTETYSWPTLTKGTNTITLSCADGDKCNVLLDQFWLKKGRVTR
ncbi:MULTISPECIES: carbohydrate-binding protein [Streptomyces]|uniref:Carbohydrate-binding protein n=2 Tax=Streptomyces TaxID=1883 RepID=A0A2U9P400_STRAS|nr:carbohydrate-binding protein [Streptomyces actuosus]AWT43974.1 carbohydrate-binding protein [Streptomyces actuosus]MBM4820886.1 carbohydrate-binding protein [Streptomyces actuosus]